MENARKKEGFIKAPRNIIEAQDLTSTEKIVLLLLIDKYNTLKAFDRLQEDGSFYITGKELEESMDIKKSQILKKHIPSLESKGFIEKISRPEDKEGSLKTYCYFTLNIGKILNHQGDQKDAEIQAKRAAKCEKMRQAIEKAAQKPSTMTDPQRPAQTTTMTAPQPQVQQTATIAPKKGFNIDDITITDLDDETPAQRDYRKHPEYYNAEEQWTEYQ